MTIDQSFYIGYISKSRGLKGELQLFFEFEEYAALDLDIIFIEIDNKLVPFFVDQIKLHNNSTAYVSFEDVDHIDKAQPLVRKKMYLPLEKMPERDPNDFRYTDLVGYLVIDEVEGELGEITEVQEMPQQFIATIAMEEKEVLFPLNEDLIVGIDQEEEVIVVKLPEGLIAMYLEQ
ncbi:ribosome maturation factor RimM [Sphingobacterium sp. HJSM2_6]|uniref:ribosome maturation factor RimM n=1 Tax=Sphingobacterium sp. HJSM2_6 TaxID=3366264 RepID=UPI003BCF5BC5